MFGEKNLGKCTMYIGIEDMPRLFCSDTFGKTYVTSKLQVSEKVTNSGGLMLVCRWVGVNALVQNKFRSTILLLNQDLLV